MNGSTAKPPIVIQPDEWSGLAAAIVQRARLMQALYADLYGAQTLWHRQILDASLLYSNPAFLQEAWQLPAPGGIGINLAAFDVRKMAGGYRLAAERLQVPRGLWRTLELRLAASRANPESFRAQKVQRLAHFFKRLRDNLDRLVPHAGASVLLAAEAQTPERAEDAALSDYLSLPLVENDDLAVRDMRVYMKTLRGLRPVGAIFRRVEDVMCDPLELRVDSGEGAVGMISALRAGNVGMMNALGAGALENPAFKPHFARICHELLGEELLLEDERAIALGDAQAAEAVFDEPEQWEFVQFDHPGRRIVYGALTPTAQLALMREMLAAPAKYVAIEHRAYEKEICFFALNTLAGETIAMPGGYTADGEDVWVVSEGEVKEFSLLAAADEPIVPTRAGGDLPSRAAANLAALGRLLANTDLNARLARGLARRLADEDWIERSEIPALVQALGSDASGLADPFAALRAFTLRGDYRGSLAEGIAALARIVPAVRDRISGDLVAALARLTHLAEPDGDDPVALLPYLAQIGSLVAEAYGHCASSMTRGYEWRFLEIGRRLDTAASTLKLMRNLLARQFRNGRDGETAAAAALLEVGDGRLTYRRRYGSRIQLAPAVDLLLCDESNPRSVAYQIAALRQLSHRLPQHADADALFSPLDRAIIRLLADLRLADCTALCTDGLDGFLDVQAQSVAAADELISRAYLDHAPRPGVVHALVTEV
ncbi:MAG: circularly permuted type 2 ATP-grasp protein [Kiritimatiellia bacterium]